MAMRADVGRRQAERAAVATGSSLIRKTGPSKAMSRKRGNIRCVKANKCFQRLVL